MRDNVDKADLDSLCDALLCLKTREECINFLEDSCTVAELRALAQRLNVARLLSRDITYNDISHMTGASTATISRVNRALQYGAGGYKSVIERLENEQC